MRYDVNSLENHWMPFTANREFKQNPRLITKSDGVYLTDHKGGTVIDGSSGLFCCPAGHGRMEIAEAVFEQMKSNDYTPPFGLGHNGSFALAEKVSQLLPENFNHVFFVNSGSEAIDTALKVVMAYHRANGDGQRTRFVSRQRAYHGVNIGGVSLSGMVKNRETFSGVMPNVTMMRHTWDENQLNVWGQPENGADLAEDLQRMVDTYGGTTIAACFVEPIAGSTGVLVPPKGYLERLRQICDTNGILLVFDEVICGFGRLGTNFGADAFGVIPDIITMAKALTNGCIPMGAVSATDVIFNTINDAAPENAIEFMHGYTYSGHPAACAAGLAALNIYAEEDLFSRAANMSKYFEESIMSLTDHPLVYDVRGYGLLAGIDLKKEGSSAPLGAEFQKEMFWNGLHVKVTGDCAIIAPPFTVEKSHIDEIIEKFRKSLDNTL